MVFETIKKIIAEQLNLSDPSIITLETSLIKDLEADSLDAVEIPLLSFHWYRHLKKNMISRFLMKWQRHLPW